MYETEENPDISSGYRGLILNLEWLPVGNVYINVRLILENPYNLVHVNRLH